MALQPCVKQILCSLSDSALRSVQSLIDGQVAILESQISIYQTQILQYDVISIPVVIAQQAAQAIVDNVRESAYLIPLGAIGDCVDLGNFNLNLQQSIDVSLSAADDFLFEAARLLSYSEELNAIVAELNDSIDQFNNISFVIEQCLSGE